ncbi:SRPBCC family protein [Azospirillum sp.]|uniref:SRPBCC family protein n=1 Tax=Azospirillum sp. TaxID=34012 RepID=UPI002D46DEF3|nr:SRPBCC family protein [Azospirillum sp.]HYD68810.1 SRPBCC family protein [Azospirillum sp.]
MRKLFAATAALLLTAAPALAAPAKATKSTQVTESVRLSVPVDQVWPSVGPFCGLSDWHPAVEKCELRQDAKGQLRLITVKGGGVIEERLLSASDTQHRITYSILSSLLPVKDYTATLSATPSGKGTKLVWTARFTPNGASEAEAKKVISGIFTSGFDGLKQRLGAQ